MGLCLHETEVDWQDDPLHETEDFFVGLDQPIQLVLAQNNVHKEVAKEVIEMANDQAEALSSDKEVTNECLDDKQVEERRPSKRIRVTQEEMSGTQKVIEKISQEKVSQQEALKKFKWTVVYDHEIKVLGEVHVELESGSKKLREKLSQERRIL
ncbi:hypothetical protein Tco_0728652 [Tanacetum coccineum]|uniref:Uncharacterized protein n=1 Tax=Tanacetum coccineum TaxID=301880 RepID=A0ABQ4YMU3_9ASTR